MEATNNHVMLNPTQLHLLKMFSFAKNEESLEEIKLALTAYLLLMVVFNLPSVLMTALLVFSVALCLTGRLNWNELAATL